ncbi:MAG: hypothetical protein P4M11_11650 [Candidatus Pacebacteria bacterium]|nr:hypothetical protein [Candidatus Paceibacterota bacterium]
MHDSTIVPIGQPVDAQKSDLILNNMPDAEGRPSVQIVGDIPDVLDDYMKRRSTFFFNSSIEKSEEPKENNKGSTGSIGSRGRTEGSRNRSLSLTDSYEDFLKVPGEVRAKLASHRAEVAQMYPRAGITLGVDLTSGSR